MQFDILPNWHPIFVHFTIALFGISTLLFFVARCIRSEEWSRFLTRAAHLNLLLGAVLTFGTVGAGLYAYYTVAHDGPSHRAMTDHRNWALVAACVWWLLALWSLAVVRNGVAACSFLGALLVAAGILAVAGFKGGEAVYRYGVGVMSLPAVEGDGSHGSHSHGEDMDHEMPSPDSTSEHGGHVGGMEENSGSGEGGDGHSHQQ
jgi:uncharacterized membrane protein